MRLYKIHKRCNLLWAKDTICLWQRKQFTIGKRYKLVIAKKYKPLLAKDIIHFAQKITNHLLWAKNTNRFLQKMQSILDKRYHPLLANDTNYFGQNLFGQVRYDHMNFKINFVDFILLLKAVNGLGRGGLKKLRRVLCSTEETKLLLGNTEWPVKHGNVFLVPWKKWLVHWTRDKVPENTAMYTSPCWQKSWYISRIRNLTVILFFYCPWPIADLKQFWTLTFAPIQVDLQVSETQKPCLGYHDRF